MCPFGAVTVIEKAHKCDLCTTGHGNGDPACVRACINGALIFVESDEEQVKAVEDMSPPRTLREMQKLTGRVTALGCFISKLGERALPFF